jgi:hypothetical protein
MIGVQRVAKIDRQHRSAIYVRRLMETNETACMIGVPRGLFMWRGLLSRVIAEFLACHPSYGRLQW